MMIYAGFWRRFNAYGIDSLIVLILCLIVGSFLGDAFAQSPEDMQALVDSGLLQPGQDPTALIRQTLLGSGNGSLISFNDVLMPILVSSAYNIFFVAGNWQATPGKHWCKIKVVIADGTRLSLYQSAMRHVASGLSIWPLGLGYITMFATREKLALHDIICHTRVIYRDLPAL